MKTWKFTDKSNWIPGEWTSEPDKASWTDEATGLPCLIVRGPSGALCGYVAVAEGHPLFGKDYEQPAVSVHGGLTYADKCQVVPKGENQEHCICHTPEPGKSDHVWWFGFDCAHSGDLSTFERRYQSRYGRHGCYRNFAYVKAEVESLAKQLAEVTA